MCTINRAIYTLCLLPPSDIDCSLEEVSDKLCESKSLANRSLRWYGRHLRGTLFYTKVRVTKLLGRILHLESALTDMMDQPFAGYYLQYITCIQQTIFLNSGSLVQWVRFWCAALTATLHETGVSFVYDDTWADQASANFWGRLFPVK